MSRRAQLITSAKKVQIQYNEQAILQDLQIELESPCSKQALIRNISPWVHQKHTRKPSIYVHKSSQQNKMDEFLGKIKFKSLQCENMEHSKFQKYTQNITRQKKMLIVFPNHSTEHVKDFPVESPKSQKPTKKFRFKPKQTNLNILLPTPTPYLPSTPTNHGKVTFNIKWKNKMSRKMHRRRQGSQKHESIEQKIRRWNNNPNITRTLHSGRVEHLAKTLFKESKTNNKRYHTVYSDNW